MHIQAESETIAPLLGLRTHFFEKIDNHRIQRVVAVVVTVLFGLFFPFDLDLHSCGQGASKLFSRYFRLTRAVRPPEMTTTSPLGFFATIVYPITPAKVQRNNFLLQSLEIRSGFGENRVSLDKLGRYGSLRGF